MEISSVSAASVSNQTASAQTSRSISRSYGSEATVETRRSDESHEVGRRRGRALGIFGKELRTALMAQFRARFAQWHSAYNAQQSSPASDDVAGEAVAAAKQVALEKPTQVAKSMVSFRSTVRESAEFVRKTVGEADGLGDVDDAVQKVEAGLDKLEKAASENRESSASVLAVDTRSKQRSTIRIRTQEGDVVRLDLKRVDRMSASDQAVSDQEGFMALTEIETSSRSRLMLRVKGDINDNELAAIRNVFSQAEAMANDFFDGDIAAAFSMAQGFEFDVEQLARVNLRFRSQQVSDIAYRETIVAPAAPQPAFERLPSTTPTESAELPEVTAAPVPAPVQEAVPAQKPAPVQNAVPIQEVTPVTEAAAIAVQPDPVAVAGEAAPERYFDALADFLRSLGEGFESRSLRYHYSESFKLQMLESVMHTMAPDDSSKADD